LVETNTPAYFITFVSRAAYYVHSVFSCKRSANCYGRKLQPEIVFITSTLALIWETTQLAEYIRSSSDLSLLSNFFFVLAKMHLNAKRSIMHHHHHHMQATDNWKVLFWTVQCIICGGNNKELKRYRAKKISWFGCSKIISLM